MIKDKALAEREAHQKKMDMYIDKVKKQQQYETAKAMGTSAEDQEAAKINDFK